MLRRITDKELIKKLSEEFEENEYVQIKKSVKKQSKITREKDYWITNIQVNDRVIEKFKPFKEGVVSQSEIVNVNDIPNVQVITLEGDLTSWFIAKHFNKI